MALHKYKNFQRFCHWSGRESMDLAYGIQKYGFTDPQKLSSIVQTKSATQVKVYIQHRTNEIRKTRKDLEKETTDKKVKCIMSRNIELQETISNLQYELESSKLEENRLSALVAKLEEDVAERDKELESYAEEIQIQLQETISNLQYELESSKLEENRLSALVAKLQEDVAERDKELESYAEEIQKIWDVASEHQEEIELLKLKQVDGNSVFGEHDDRRKLVEKEYKLIPNKPENMLKNYENNQRCKVFGKVTRMLLQDQELTGVEFQQWPYHRIFIELFLELSASEADLEATPQILTTLCNTLYYLRPQKAPGFAYAWLELISHRVFLGRVLTLSPAQTGWTMYARLLVSLFKFLAPFLRNAELAAPIELLYKGTLRVLVVLLHDFPEFLCDYHYEFCDVIAPNCIQMRNLILSAFPRNMRLPDPFTPNLKVDLLPEIRQAPRILANFNNLIQPPSFKKDLDSYIKTRAPVTFLSELITSLQVSNEPGMRYNIPLINALVLYVGTEANIQNKGNTPNMSTIMYSSHMDIFQKLAVDLDTEGRYFFLNAIANQLRHPNSHTFYFSCTLLYLFAEANTEAIQEQITRVLLERLIVNQPHPWGLLITFIELIKNQNFKFWNHEFVRCAPEIEKLFESVVRSCMHPKPSSEQITL